MRNITNVPSMQSCTCCNQQGFFCYTPDGADYITCPCCGLSDDEHRHWDDDYEEGHDLEEFHYCKQCKIMFKVACIHRMLGCTSSVYNCHFVKRWKNKITGEEFFGMPEFNDFNDLKENEKNVEILELICPHNGAVCPESKNGSPRYQSYYGCSLCGTK